MGLVLRVSTLLAALLPAALAAQQPPGLDVPYVPTPQAVVDQMLALAAPTRTDMLYDLGSGDGRIVITAARQFGTRGIGVDLNPDRIAESNANARRAGVTERVRFLRQDLFKTDLRPATVLTLYLLPSVNMDLRPKLFEQLRPGTRIVSHAFSMGDWEPDSTVTVRRADGLMSNIYFWVMPARVSGTWTARGPEGTRFTFHVDQRLQKIHGRATINGRVVPLSEPRVRGTEISFGVPTTANGRQSVRRFTGRVAGGAIRGTVAGGGAWTARRTGPP